MSVLERAYEYLCLEVQGGVLTCTLSNPPKHTLTSKGVREVLQLIEDADADASVRVLVFVGADPRIFIAHYELGEVSALADAAATKARDGSQTGRAAAGAKLYPFNRLGLALERSDVITVAAINGFASGGGCELALACDFRLMSDSVRGFGLPETSVGIIPGAGGTQRMARLLGTARALDLILHAKLIRPAEALDLGLVHRVLPHGEFRREVDRFAEDLASRAPIALSAAKAAIRQGAGLPLESALLWEQQCLERTMQSRDAAGAMKALLGGGSYEWKGE
jgi:enoyl-CoA hydratase